MFDCVIKNALIFDGNGNEPVKGAVAIKDGKIADVGEFSGFESKLVIDAKLKAICPGFIDVHSHADLVIHKENHDAILKPLIMQGITTFVGGNCGMGLFPISKTNRNSSIEYVDAMIGDASKKDVFQWNDLAGLLEHLKKQGVALNVGFLVPHGMVRIAAKGWNNTPANSDEIKVMAQLLNENMEAGALGMSSGLMYFPGLAADEIELDALAKVVASYNGVFASHLRSYTNTIIQAFDEVITLSQKYDMKTQISHLFWLPHYSRTVDYWLYNSIRVASWLYNTAKIRIDKLNIGSGMGAKLEYLDNHINKGLPLGIDGMPTGTGFTHAFAFFPTWALIGGKDEIENRLKDKQTRKMIYDSICYGKSEWPHRAKDTWSMNFFQIVGFRAFYFMSVVTEKNKIYEGMSLHEVGKLRGQHPFDALCDILIEENGRVLLFQAVTYPGDDFIELNVKDIAQHPHVSFVTDTILMGFGKPSHMFYDCYPRVLSKYVKKKWLSVAEAIRKSTSLPAKQLGIPKRGLIEKGFWADLVLFDPNTIDTKSTPEKPDCYPTGINYVWINGQMVVSPEGYDTKIRKGQLILKS